MVGCEHAPGMGKAHALRPGLPLGHLVANHLPGRHGGVIGGRPIPGQGRKLFYTDGSYHCATASTARA